VNTTKRRVFAWLLRAGRSSLVEIIALIARVTAHTVALLTQHTAAWLLYASSCWRRLSPPFIDALPAPPPLPAPCAPFATRGGQPVECALELVAGQTYVLHSDCGRVKGDTRLTLRDPHGVDVAFNDGFPFCANLPGGATASLPEFYVACEDGSSAKFSLLQDCFEGTECGGATVVEYSAKEEPVNCGRGPFVCARQDATCEALGDLYYATNGPCWANKQGWEAAGFAIEYCSFYYLQGLACDSDGALTSLCVPK
jgi:hypothetical protein